MVSLIAVALVVESVVVAVHEEVVVVVNLLIFNVRSALSLVT